MTSITNKQKLGAIKRFINDGYGRPKKLTDLQIDKLYLLFTQNMIPDESNDPNILCYTGIYYDAISRNFLKSEEYFEKALENDCYYSAWNLVILYHRILTINKYPSGGKIYDKYYKYLKLSFCSFNVDACCSLYYHYMKNKSRNEIHVLMIGTLVKCRNCMFKLANILFKQQRYEESLYLCNFCLKIEHKKKLKIQRNNKWTERERIKLILEIDSSIRDICYLLGENMLKLELHKKYVKLISEENNKFRRKLERTYTKDICNIIMNYYTVIE